MVHCPICASKLDESFLKAPALDVSNSDLYEYMFCSDCNVIVLTDNKTKVDESVDYSSSGYYSRKETKAKLIIRGIASIFSLFRVNIVKRFLGKSGLNGLDILDIGCGKGGFLAAAKDKGASIHGLEPTNRSFEVAKSKLGLSVQNMMMSKSIYAKDSIDIVTMWHVFEHIPKPLNMLSDCEYVLKKDGLLVIAVPNYRGLIAKLGGALWFNLDPPRHIIHYSEKALREIVGKSGFRVINVTHHYAELTYFSSLQTLLNLLPISKNYLFNYLKRNHAALPKSRLVFLRDALVTVIVGSVILPFVIIMTFVASVTRYSDCITLIARKI